MGFYNMVIGPELCMSMRIDSLIGLFHHILKKCITEDILLVAIDIIHNVFKGKKVT